MHRLSDIFGSTDRAELSAAESAFRRGFHHAAQLAWLAAQAGATAEEIGAWSDRVEEWRNDWTAPDGPPAVIGPHA